jgi:hypothetical protein
LNSLTTSLDLFRSLHIVAGEYPTHHQTVSTPQILWLQNLNVFFLRYIITKRVNCIFFSTPIVIISLYSKISRSGHLRVWRNISCCICLVLSAPPKLARYKFIHPVYPFSQLGPVSQHFYLRLDR